MFNKPLFKSEKLQSFQDIQFKVVYSRRRSLGISVLPDASVIVRVPYRTSDKTIIRIVSEKSEWIIKHRDNYSKQGKIRPARLYADGEIHLFRGRESVIRVEKSSRSYTRFYDGTIELGLGKPQDSDSVKNLLYKGYKTEANLLFPQILSSLLTKYEDQKFRPESLIIRKMKRRWGSCSNKGVITLSTELIKLSDLYIEYVVTHELCHLKHHNHGVRYYKLLSELFPEWKTVRKEMQKYIR